MMSAVCGQFHELICALVGFEIEDDTALAEIVMPEMQAAVGMRVVVVKRTVTPGFFAAEGFDFDNVGAETS